MKRTKNLCSLVALTRTTFSFNRRDYGRLRQLINVLNGL
jgi:hypothetical protein